MAEDSFFQMFLTEISKLSSISIAFDDSFRDVYLSFWHEFDGKSEESPSFVVADGSYAHTTFRGGVRAAVARAIANVYSHNNLIGDICDVDLRVGHGLKRISLYMRALEFKCLKRALESYSEVQMALCDGDLYPIIPPVLVKLGDQEVEAYAEYLNAFYDLYKLAAERMLLLIGVTKDSFVNYLGVKILSTFISQENPILGRELSRVRSVKNILKKLSENRDQLKNCDAYLKEVGRMLMSSDEEIFDDYTNKSGFTYPLVLAPQPIYLSEEIKAGTRRWADSRIRRRLLAAGNPFSKIAEAFDRICELPPVVMSYWRPWHGIGVYRIDIGGWILGLNSDWGSVEGDYFLEGSIDKLREVIAVLNSLSPEPFTVKPLLDVDDLVRFRTDIYKECYEPLIIEALRRAGLKAVLTKRDLRELMVR